MRMTRFFSCIVWSKQRNDVHMSMQTKVIKVQNCLNKLTVVAVHNIQAYALSAINVLGCHQYSLNVPIPPVSCIAQVDLLAISSIFFRALIRLVSDNTNEDVTPLTTHEYINIIIDGFDHLTDVIAFTSLSLRPRVATRAIQSLWPPVADRVGCT